MPTRALALMFLLVAAAGGCKSTTTCAACENAQAAVEKVAKANPDVTRLTVHCLAKDGAGALCCASTSAQKRGKPSDPEDLKAMQTGQPVVLQEGAAVDVTVPILAKDGRCTAAAGVTLQPGGMNNEQVIAKAKTIATALEAELAAGGGCACSCPAPK